KKINVGHAVAFHWGAILESCASPRFLNPLIATNPAIKRNTRRLVVILLLTSPSRRSVTANGGHISIPPEGSSFWSPLKAKSVVQAFNLQFVFESQRLARSTNLSENGARWLHLQVCTQLDSAGDRCARRNRHWATPQICLHRFDRLPLREP